MILQVFNCCGSKLCSSQVAAYKCKLRYEKLLDRALSFFDDGEIKKTKLFHHYYSQTSYHSKIQFALVMCEEREEKRESL